METTALVASFVDLFARHSLREMGQLTKDEVQVLLGLVTAAGFSPGSIVLGNLEGSFLDDDGSRTGETFPINHLSPFKVVDKDGRDRFFATGWLDCAFRLVALERGGREEQISALTREVERSVPLTPIQLTSQGDFLQEYPPQVQFLGLSHFVPHTRDDNTLSSCVGVHTYCGGWMDRNRATATHDAIVCRSCHLRVLFPKTVKTYGELRQALRVDSVLVAA